MRVEKLLAAQKEATEYFDDGRIQRLWIGEPPQFPRGALGLNADDIPGGDEFVGKFVGPYKLLQRIGEGGCGAVYMAGQEKPVRRKVALKIIKLGMDTRSVIVRFEAERQALAMMDHPNIARVLDAGATELGRPFFVMELVRGVKITDYCDQNQLDTRQRLELFIEVCHAIQHAHQKGVIHRDIKPSNILITTIDGVGVPKVIDFGIAKAIEGRLTDSTIFTAYEQFIGTPAYMSPEQAVTSGVDVDTRSDIYSLGVLLYELLTGRPPFETRMLMQGGIDSFRRTLQEREPQRPSAMVTTMQGSALTQLAHSRHTEPPKLISTLRGDLDWIVIRALEKDRARRYQTANALAMDLERYLNNEPVVARPPSRFDRLQKLVQRNRVSFAAGALVVLALIAGLGGTTWMFLKARQAWANEAALREQAEAREKLTQAVVFVNQGNYEAAEKLIETIKTPPTRPSLDGVSALRSVGEWLALQGRWREAASRFSELMEIDKLDSWDLVTLDYQSCGVVLVESGDVEAFDRFREAAVERFMNSTNGDAAGRILKTSLLPPVHENTLAQLQPLGDLAAKWTAAQSRNGLVAGWAAIPVALWKYRVGDFAKAEEYCRTALVRADGTAKTATLHLIMAMACHRNGQEDEAQDHLAKGRALVHAKFKKGLDRGTWGSEMWYDWLFARILLREAEALIPPSAEAK